MKELRTNKLDALRRQIDEIDARLLDLLNQRAGCTIEVGKAKKELSLPIYDPEREKTIHARLEQLNGGPLSDEAVRRLFERIIDESRHLEKDIVLQHNNTGNEAK